MKRALAAWVLGATAIKSRGRRGAIPLAFTAILFGGWSCATAADEAEAVSVSHTETIAESPAVQSRVEELRARFLLPAPTALLADTTTPRAQGLPTSPRPVLGASAASGFELHDGAVRAVIPAEAKRGVLSTASVALPLRASEPVRIEDDASHLAVSFALRGANSAAATTAGGIALYSGALPEADVIHRVHAEGTEDYVVFEQRPAKEEIAYEVDVSRVAGLRLVSNTLEFLDEGGAPRLRIAPPQVLDATNTQKEAVLVVDGCAFDTNPKAPWGRAVTRPGASRCTVRVAWEVAAYPALVDPSWTVTSSMTIARNFHSAIRLASGQVLVAGGYINTVWTTTASAELYDPASGSFAATGSMSVARCVPTLTLLGSGQVLTAGGWLGPGFAASADAELYDPTTGVFSTTAHAMTSPRRIHTATLLGSGKVLLAGGLSSPAAASALSSAELYDPTTGDFVATTDSMSTPRGNHGAVALASGKVLIAGGADNTSVLSSAEVYDPESGTFTVTGPMTTERMATPVAVLLHSGKALVVGGYGGTIDGNHGVGTSSAELYDESTGTFAATGSLATGRYWHTVTLLDSGSVLVAGGWTNAEWWVAAAGAEVYDPGAGTFAPAGMMMAARGSHTATLLASGEVLIAGGYNGGQLRGAERFSTSSVDGGPDASADTGGDHASGDGGCSVARHHGAPAAAMLWLVAGGMIGLRRLRRRRGRANSQPRGSVLLLALLLACTHCSAENADASTNGPAIETIHLVGRFDTSGQGALFAYPASTIRAHFTGTGIDLKLADNADWFDVSIDDGAATALEMTGAPSYRLASGLSPGEHEVTITKRTESCVGSARFESLTPIDGELVPTPFPYKRKIEIIGDSLSTGSGALGTDPCIGTPDLENENVAWGSLAATELGAMRTVIAYGGSGISRNSAGGTEAILPDIWTRTIADDPTSTWDFSKNVPDVVIVLAGTNDFTVGDPGLAFVDTYVSFLASIRSKYPSAFIVCASLSTPPQLVSYVQDVVKKANDAGDAKVSYVAVLVGTTDFSGCGYHPSVAGHVSISETIVAHIRDVTGW